MNLRKMGFFILITVGILSVISGFAYAGGLYIYEMANPTDTGYAGAGLAGRANDAMTVFTNPAGMTRFKKTKKLAGLTPLFIHGPFEQDQNTTVSGSDGSVNLFLAGGAFSYIRPLTEKLRLGVSVQNYFGLALKDWSDSFVGRYQVIKEALIAPQLQPTIAYKVTNWLSIGAGAGLTLGYLSSEKNFKNLDPSLADGTLKYSDTAFAVQGNFGVMIEPSDRFRIGLRYLTQADLDFDDNIYLSGAGPGIADLTKSAGNLDLGVTMPQSLMAGIFYQINDTWAILGSVGWDEWSRFAKINVTVDGTGINRQVDAGFDDVWHFGVGAQYQYNPKLMLTGGFSYDTSMADGSTRPIALPMGEMYRYALGFKYKKSDDLLLGGGLSFLWEGDMKIKPANSLAGQVSGDYKNTSITFLSFYVQW